MKSPFGLIAILLTVPGAMLAGQARTMAQDSTLNNFRLPAGTPTTPYGELGRVRTAGTGSRTMILIAGMGFGDDVWTDFMEQRKTDFSMHAVTLPGFGGTAPPAMPAVEGRFAETAWINSSLRALEALLEMVRPRRVTVVAHWAVASQIALRLALDHPERVEAVVLIGGSLKAVFPGRPETHTWTPEQRSQWADAFGQRWFRTVTRPTWDDNNYMPYDYAVNPRRGLFLWRQAQAPLLPVWIRYLLEFYAMDLSPRLKELRVPTLVVHPDFDDPAYYVEGGVNYMKSFCVENWNGAAELSRHLEFVTIKGSRLFVMFDKPAELNGTIDGFLDRHRK